jgi:hypothetical protein
MLQCEVRECVIAVEVVGSAECNESCSPATRLDRRVPKIQNAGSSAQDCANHVTLHANAPPVNDSQGLEAQPVSLGEIFFYDTFDVPWWNRVEIEYIGDWNPEGRLRAGHGSEVPEKTEPRPARCVSRPGALYPGRSAPDELHREPLTRVLQFVIAHKLLHLVLEVEFELFQTMFFNFFSGCKRVLGFERLDLPVILLVFFHELTVFLIRLHQVRLDVFLCVLFHSGHLS